MTLEDTGEAAAPETEAPQAEAAPAEVTTTDEAQTEEVNTDEVKAEPELTLEEKYEKLEREVAGKQKKIDRQTAANKKVQENYEKERQEREKLLTQIEKQKPEQEPVIDDFDTHDEYVNALADYRASVKFTERQTQFLAQQEQAQQQEVMNERLTLRHTQEAEYVVENPMYKAAANEVDLYVKNIDSSPAVQDAVIEQLYDGNVPQVIDYFGANNGENLDELGAISKLSPTKAAVAIYKIQQKLSVNPVAKKETKSPTRPVKVGAGKSTGSKSLARSSGSDILDWVKAK